MCNALLALGVAELKALFRSQIEIRHPSFGTLSHRLRNALSLFSMAPQPFFLMQIWEYLDSGVNFGITFVDGTVLRASTPR